MCRAALRLCLLLGQRQANVLGMRVDQLALEDRLWLIPASTTKTARTYKVPLSAAAVAIIKARIAELQGAGADPVTWLFLVDGIDLDDEEAVVSGLASLDLVVDGDNRLWVRGDMPGDRLRIPEVEARVSNVVDTRRGAI